MVTELNDYELIYNIKNNNDSQSLLTFTHRHEGLIIGVMAKVFNGSGIGADVMATEKYYVVNSAARSYNLDKNTKPTTWVSNIARFHALNLLRDHIKHNVIDESDIDEITEIIDKNDADDSYGKIEQRDILNYIKKLAEIDEDKRIKDIIDFRYFNCENRLLSYKAVGARLNPKLSTQGVKNILDGFLKRVKIGMKLEEL